MPSTVFLTNVGFVKIGDHWSKSLTDLAFDSSKKILAQSSFVPDAVVVANAACELTSFQGNLGALVTDSLHLEGACAMRIESAGASGGAAIQVATNLIRSGQSSSVLIVGVEKMRDLDPAKITIAQALSEHAEYSQFFGISFPSVNALVARMYMKQYNVDRERLSSFPAIAHRNSSTCEHAQFKKKFTADEISRSEIVSDPLRVLDCAPVGDGAASALLVRGDLLSNEQKREGVKILASESFSGTAGVFEREDPLRFSSTEAATQKALHVSKCSLDSISFFEIHDSYSISAALSVEAIGLSRRGDSCKDAALGKFDLGAKHPCSTFGGMKARGYPMGAAGVYQLCEAFLQLTDQAGSNQVPHASKGLLQTNSGIDSSAYVQIVSSGGE